MSPRLTRTPQSKATKKSSSSAKNADHVDQVGLRTFFEPGPAEALISQGLSGVILDGARRCLLRFGPKMTVGDVASAADVSRGSIYKYYTNREQLLEAVNDLAFSLFVQDVDTAMAARTTFPEQIVAAAIQVRRWNTQQERVRADDVLDDVRPQLTPEQSKSGLMKELTVIRRYLELAQARGEVRRDLNVDQASEWVVRITHSFGTNPALTFDADDDDATHRFVTQFIVRGLS